MPIAPGDHLLLYTDGVSDALFREEDGDSRIDAAIEHHTAGGAVLLEALLAEIGRHGGGRSPQDNLTLLTATLL